MHSEDYGKDGSTPYLQQWMTGEDARVRSSQAVAEVRGEVDRTALEELLRNSCGAKSVPFEGISKHRSAPKCLHQIVHHEANLR